MDDRKMIVGPVLRLNSISEDRRQVRWISPPTGFPLPLLGNFNIDDEHPAILPVGEVLHASLMQDNSWWVLAMIDGAYAPGVGEDYDVGTEITVLEADIVKVDGDLPNGPGSEIVCSFIPNGVLTVDDGTLDAVVAYVTMGASSFGDVWLRRPPERDQNEHWNDQDWENLQSILVEYDMIKSGWIGALDHERR